MPSQLVHTPTVTLETNNDKKKERGTVSKRDVIEEKSNRPRQKERRIMETKKDQEKAN